MNTPWPEKVVVIDTDPSGSGYTEILRGALSSHNPNTKVTRITNRDMKVVDADLLAFWVLASKDFIPPTEGALKDREPSDDAQALWSLLQIASSPVHLIVPSEWINYQDSRFTALDTVAMILSGVSGVWEGRPKLAADLHDRKMLDHLRFSWEFRRVFLYGRLASQLYDFYLKIAAGAWPVTDETLPDLKIKYCFETALALACMTTEEMKILDVKARPGMEKYAQRLLEFRDRTGLSYAASVVTQALRNLDRGWAGRILNHDKMRRNEMPLWAHQDGFPARLPLIKNCAPHEISQNLYNGLWGLYFEREWEPGKLDYTTVGVRN